MSTDTQTADTPDLSWVNWRCIGPHRGGRSVAVAGHPTEAMVFYFGACAGGVWKTVDGGTYWENVSDGFFNTAAVGAIAVSESDPNVVYAGTGESCIRGNVSHGDGVYRSTDGGKTWSHLGLEDTRHIARVRIHPKDADTAYVAALGHAFGPNEQRGVFRTTDGGKTWEKVLYRSENAGAIDLSMDPNNPRILYASIWQARREPWKLTSGGPESGIFKSNDGGDSWTEITENAGLPEGLKGRIGVAISPAKPERVWALVEAEKGGLFRSENGGEKWERVSEDRSLQQRPWYYSHVFADPQDANTVWVLNTKAWKSTDGGSSFTQVGTPHGDNHDLWIDPRDPRRMVEGNDGGACVSFNGGETWSTIYNQPTSQFYHVATDNQFPYRVYGTQQDNSAISVPSRTFKGAIPYGECYTVGTSESGHIAVHPENPNVVYSGAIGSSDGGGDSLLRYDLATRQARVVSVWPEFAWGFGPKDHKYRFQWTYPILFSPHDVNVLYVAGNVLFRSTDEGTSWEAISPDLTRNDVTKMEPSGGPITLDTTFVEHYGTIFAFIESPHEAGVFWAGSDDGLVHLSLDGGETWDDITPRDLPEWTRIDVIEVSPHDPATAYLAATRYKLDDTRPFLYKTSDYGRSWVKITNGLPETDFTRVIRADPERPGLLYCGTELGIYVSFDDGETWQSIRGNLPVVPVTDLKVEGRELVASTNGRSFWVLGDLTALRQLAEDSAEAPVRLFTPAAAYRVAGSWRSRTIVGGTSYMLTLGEPATYRETKDVNGHAVRTLIDAGTDAPNGVEVVYRLNEKPEGEVKLTFLDGDGNKIKSFTSAAPETKEEDSEDEEPRVPSAAGMNRSLWDMRYPDGKPTKKPGVTAKGVPGPLAPPGRYQVRLETGDSSETRSFELLKDPRVAATQQDLRAQFDLSIRIRDKSSEAHSAVNRIRRVRAQVDGWVERAGSNEAWAAVTENGEKLKESLSAVEEDLVQLKTSNENDRISQPAKLSAKMAELATVPASADSAPTRVSYTVFEKLSGELDEQLARLQTIIDEDLAAFISIVQELEIPPVVPDPAL